MTETTETEYVKRRSFSLEITDFYRDGAIMFRVEPADGYFCLGEFASRELAEKFIHDHGHWIEYALNAAYQYGIAAMANVVSQAMTQVHGWERLEHPGMIDFNRAREKGKS